MKNRPRVSIITGAYNIRENEADLAIQSILDQTFKDFEFIICDDGSTNNTWQILRKWAKKDSRIVLIKNDMNMGLGASLNACIEASKGIYIARMDLDDYCVPRRLAIQVKFLDDNPKYSIVTSNGAIFDQDHHKPYGERILPERPTKKSMLFNSPFLHAGAMMRKKSLLEVDGYRVAKETRRAEDYDLWMRMYASDMIGYNIQDLLYFIREDRNAYNRRKYKYRIDEMVVRYKGFKSLGLLPSGLPYVIKPLIVGLIPGRIMKQIRKGRKR